ncbi:4'-phosphopantetheinyl transferase superfamily protein [Arthrobacter sp. HLT1-21]
MLTPDEERKLRSAELSRQARTFTRTWTRKEAILKATGRGLFAELHRLRIEDVDGPPIVTAWPPSFCVPEQIRIINLQDHPAKIGSLAVLTREHLSVREHYGPRLINM